MTEKGMLKALKKAFEPRIKFTSIETGATASGVPDVYYSSMVNDEVGWIELKIAKIKKDGVIEIPYRPGQINWLKDYVKRNKKGYTLIYHKKKYYLTQEFERFFMNDLDLMNESILIMSNMKNEHLIRELIRELIVN